MRFRLSRMMWVMLPVCVALHLGIVAYQVYSGLRPHVHSGVVLTGKTPGLAVAAPIQPFWPAYWRQLLGLAGGCKTHSGFMMEMCELAHPEIRMSLGPDSYGANHTRGQRDLWAKLEAENQPPKQRDLWGEFVQAVNRKLESLGPAQ